MIFASASPLAGYEKFVESIGPYPGGNISYLYSLDGFDLAIIAVYFAMYTSPFAG